ncbi:MAG: DUF2877 domain-containing protein [Candidatus Dormibacteraceae bacterium]
MRVRSVSNAVLPLFRGPFCDGVGLGSGYVDFDGYVLALTRPGRPRMPNGVECGVDLAPGARCRIGGGWLVVDGHGLLPGPLWNPVPEPRVRPRPGPGPAIEFDVEQLAGRGEGLTPAGDDLLAGYAAGLVLFHGRHAEAAAIAAAAAPRTTRLAATLLRHASRGELPEPAHALLEDGDPGPLTCFGHSSGRCLLAGLAAGAAAC